MKSFLAKAAIVARRDFLAVVATPTFLLFLLAPLLMIGIGLTGGSGASQVAQSTAKAARIAVIADRKNAEGLREAYGRIQGLSGSNTPPAIEIVPTGANDAATARALFADRKLDFFAVMYGDLAKPVIMHEQMSTRSAKLLAEMAEQVTRERQFGLSANNRLSKPVFQPLIPERGGVGSQRTAGYFAVFGIFFLTLLLAGQAVGMLAEEKSNKVIEVLAAAAPLEAVFLGKLIGMFGAALLFVAFWAALLGGVIFLSPAGATVGTMLDPAVGVVPFLLLCAAYFTMSYMLLGAVFLGVGAQAATVRDIQMLSLPITIFQVGMFALASSAASSPGSSLAWFAEVFPFSSPLAMAGRAASSVALWPHFLALVWQGLWVVLTIFVAARLFRMGVLKSGGGLRAFFSFRG